MNKQVDAEVRHDLIEDMRADLGELEEMVSELLTYARLEHGNVGSHREIVDAASWLDSVVADVALEAEAAGVTCEISACQVEQIRIEPRFMARAVINLLRNAIRHAHSRVEIALLDQGDSCQIRVNDDGPGIPADARQKIFEPFSRLDDSRIAAPAASAWAWRSSAGRAMARRLCGSAGNAAGRRLLPPDLGATPLTAEA